MKKILKGLVVSVLAHQVKRLRKKHDFKVIAVVGGIGKTSTKLAIAQTLGESLKVRYQHGNYNDIVTVPLIFFGHEQPSLFNPVVWLKVFWSNNKQIAGKYPYDVIVLELGTDGPGQIVNFNKYGAIDIAVVTSITPEHMENFADMQAVANEELSVASFSKQLLYNSDLMPPEYVAMLPANSLSYGIENPDAGFHLTNIFHSANGFEADLKTSGEIFIHINYEAISHTQLYSVLGAIVASKQLGLTTTQIKQGIVAIKPVSGRLRRLRGMNNSLIIDDSYNSSPDAARFGLDMLKNLKAEQQIIAVLGNMNEMGQSSVSAHKEVGELCDPKVLNEVITIGTDANVHLAQAAEAKGCSVRRFDDPYSVGEYLQTKIEPGAIILVKGSQNGVFLEEAIKKILADPEDASKLVRQSEYWMNMKKKQFKVSQ